MEVHRERGQSAGVERVRFLGAARGVEVRGHRSNESCKSQRFLVIICFRSKALILRC